MLYSFIIRRLSRARMAGRWSALAPNKSAIMSSPSLSFTNELVATLPAASRERIERELEPTDLPEIS